MPHALPQFSRLNSRRIRCHDINRHRMAPDRPPEPCGINNDDKRNRNGEREHRAVEAFRQADQHGRRRDHRRMRAGESSVANALLRFFAEANIVDHKF